MTRTEPCARSPRCGPLRTMGQAMSRLRRARCLRRWARRHTATVERGAAPARASVCGPEAAAPGGAGRLPDPEGGHRGRLNPNHLPAYSGPDRQRRGDGLRDRSRLAGRPDRHRAVPGGDRHVRKALSRGNARDAERPAARSPTRWSSPSATPATTCPEPKPVEAGQDQPELRLPVAARSR